MKSTPTNGSNIPSKTSWPSTTKIYATFTPKTSKTTCSWSGAYPPALTRAAITHLYFVCIHPLKDGNGRIGRAIAEKPLAQSFGQPTLIALSRTIQKHKKAYYDGLEHNNKGIEITDWLVYFSKTILQAQLRTQSLIDFVIEKT